MPINIKIPDLVLFTAAEHSSRSISAHVRRRAETSGRASEGLGCARCFEVRTRPAAHHRLEVRSERAWQDKVRSSQHAHHNQHGLSTPLANCPPPLLGDSLDERAVHENSPHALSHCRPHCPPLQPFSSQKSPTSSPVILGNFAAVATPVHV